MDYNALASYLIRKGTEGDVSIWEATGNYFEGTLPLSTYVEFLKVRGIYDEDLERILENE